MFVPTARESCAIAINKIAKEDLHLKTLEAQGTYEDYSAQSVAQLKLALTKAFTEGYQAAANLVVQRVGFK